MNFKEKTLETNYIYKGKILNLRNDKVELPDGKVAYREIVEHSGGAAVYCEHNGKVLLVKQFRYPYKEEIYEIPAGKINVGEDPLETARRELYEEGGVIAKKLEKIYEVYPTPGYTEEIIRIYKAEDLTFGENKLDEGEFLSSVWIDKQTLKEMIKSGEIKDAKTLICLLTVL
ncbi:MAG: NUDIX hydrolase [Clostridia bacterium]|nr:NUDIX hydrolase [Clostridia bacterium]